MPSAEVGFRRLAAESLGAVAAKEVRSARRLRARKIVAAVGIVPARRATAVVVLRRAIRGVGVGALIVTLLAIFKLRRSGQRLRIAVVVGHLRGRRQSRGL